jgi:hypothetical protein
MTKQYTVEDNGATALAITGSASEVFETPLMPLRYERAYFQVTFYSDIELQNVVTATGGTIELTGAMTEDKLWKNVDSGTLNASEVYDINIAVPSASGAMLYAKAEFKNITGAAYAKVVAVRY